MKKVWTLLVLLCLMVGLCFALASCGEHEHTWDNGKVTKATTCEDVGVKTYTCTDCGETKTEDIAALGHDYSVFDSDADNHWKKCARCGEADSTTEAAHKYTEDKTSPDYKPATCSANGQAVMVCECGRTELAPIPATGDHEKGTELKQDKDGHFYECVHCGMQMEYAEHDWTLGTVSGLSASSCAEGTRKDTCSVCNYERDVKVASPKAHTYTFTVDNANKKVTMTCSECHKSVVHESMCSMDFEDNNVGDTFAEGGGQKSTGSVVCEEENGNLYGKLIHDVGSNTYYASKAYTSIAGYEYFGVSYRLKLWFTDADGVEHKSMKFKMNCRTDGSSTHDNGAWGRFGEVDIDENGNLRPIYTSTDIEVKKDAWYQLTYIYHIPTRTVILYVNDGENTFVSYGCNTDLVPDYFPFANNGSVTIQTWQAIAYSKEAVCIDDIMVFFTNGDGELVTHEHTWDDGRVTREPDCRPGIKTYTCTVCGGTKTEDITEGMTGHNPGTEYFYTTPAETAGDPDVIDLVNHWHKCTVCGEICGTEEHNWVEDTSKHQDPTATSKGSATYNCVCGAQKTEEIEALHHIDASKWESDDKQHWNACTDEGCTDPKVNLADHDWTVKNVNKAPTCTENGESVYVCSVCGKEKTESVAAIGHKFGGAVHDSETGKVTFACEHDNCTETKVYVVSGNHAYDGTNDLSIGTVNEVSYTKETDEDGNSYYFVKRETAGTTQPQTYYNYAVQKGAFYIEIAENGVRGTSTFALNFYNMANSSSGTNNMKGNSKFETILHIEGGLIYKFNGTSGNAPIGKVEDGVKNRFFVEFEAVPADESNAAMINYTIYMNGELLTTGSMVNLLPNGEIAGLHLRVNLAAGNSFSFDNFYMMETPSED